MKYTNIQALLETRLGTVVNLPDLQLENSKITRIAGQPWARFTFLPAPTAQSSIGVDGYNRMQGLAQVSLFYPINKGTTDINTMVDAVIAAFPRGLQLTDGEVTVQVEMAYREVGSALQEYYQIPVSIRWRSFQR